MLTLPPILHKKSNFTT